MCSLLYLSCHAGHIYSLLWLEINWKDFQEILGIYLEIVDYVNLLVGIQGLLSTECKKFLKGASAPHI